jgi:hypothetical protein
MEHPLSHYPFEPILDAALLGDVGNSISAGVAQACECLLLSSRFQCGSSPRPSAVRAGPSLNSVTPLSQSSDITHVAAPSICVSNSSLLLRSAVSLGVRGIIRTLICRRISDSQSAVVMVLRTCAFHPGNRTVHIFLSSMFCVQIAVQSFASFEGIRMLLSTLLLLPCDRTLPALQSSTFPGCVSIGRTDLLAALWIAPLVTDTCILSLTLWQARHYVEERSVMP